MKRRVTVCWAALVLAASARAEVVHVSTDVNGTVSTTSIETQSAFTTPSAPTVSGKIFTGWTISTGEPMVSRDAMGRSLESVTATIYQDTTLTANYLPSSQDDDNDGIADGYELYWYGDSDEGADSDTDGDGFRLGAEVALGMNPLVSDEAGADAEIITATGPWQEVNLQCYEQVGGAVVNGEYAVFPVCAGEAQVWPVVADVNGDGLWDLIVVSTTTTNVFVNTGTKGNPQFKVAAREDTSSTGEDGETVLRVTYEQLAAVDLEMNSMAKLAGMTLDVAPVGALSATTNAATMLVSDEEGRIWYYARAAEDVGPYQLQHKVWGGSYAGFASGLRLAAVDWEDDGDLDCLCGTAEGKLMLLRDPKVGRPTNLKALTGADNVNLTWDPNVQSRIRGYKVYRGEADSTSFVILVSPYAPLPTYRDYPPNIAAYDYKVSSVSRFYTAGNSTPTESESMPTEAVRANLGSVSLAWHDASVCANTNAEVMLSIDNSLGLAAEATLVVSYDPAVLEFVAVEKSGITEAANVSWTLGDSSLTISLTGGQIAAGQGTFLSLVFRPTAAAKATLQSQESLVSQVSLASATLLSTASKSITVLLPEAAAKVTLLPAQNDPTIVPPYSLGDIDGDGHLTILDLRLLAKLKSTYGRKYSANQLAAGDFNGNNKLDNADYQALRELLRKLGIIQEEFFESNPEMKKLLLTATMALLGGTASAAPGFVKAVSR